MPDAAAGADEEHVSHPARRPELVEALQRGDAPQMASASVSFIESPGGISQFFARSPRRLGEEPALLVGRQPEPHTLRSPGTNRVTAGPVASTTPQPSDPKTVGSFRRAGVLDEPSHERGSQLADAGSLDANQDLLPCPAWSWRTWAV